MAIFEEKVVDDDFYGVVPKSPRFVIYKRGLRESAWSVKQLILYTRSLLMNGNYDPDCRFLIAKLEEGENSIQLFVDRDSYEFVGWNSRDSIHVAGGNLANELSWIPFQGLKKIMQRHLENLCKKSSGTKESPSEVENEVELDAQMVSACYLPLTKTVVAEDV